MRISLICKNTKWKRWEFCWLFKIFYLQYSKYLKIDRNRNAEYDYQFSLIIFAVEGFSLTDIFEQTNKTCALANIHQFIYVKISIVSILDKSTDDIELQTKQLLSGLTK